MEDVGKMMPQLRPPSVLDRIRSEQVKEDAIAATGVDIEDGGVDVEDGPEP